MRTITMRVSTHAHYNIAEWSSINKVHDCVYQKLGILLYSQIKLVLNLQWYIVIYKYRVAFCLEDAPYSFIAMCSTCFYHHRLSLQNAANTAMYLEEFITSSG